MAELLPISGRGRRDNKLEEAKRRIREATPEPELIDPELFNPVQRNPQGVNDAINALTRSRQEASEAADIASRETFNQQIQQMILSQVLGLGGAISNAATGGNVQTGIDQRVEQALPTALGLQDRLTRTLNDRALARTEATGQAGVDIARSNEEARVANELEARTQSQALQTAIQQAEAAARESGNTVLAEFQRITANEQRDRAQGTAEVNAAANLSRAETARLNALKPKTTSGSGPKKPGDKGFLSQSLRNFSGKVAANKDVDNRLQRIESGEATFAEEDAGSSIARSLSDASTERAVAQVEARSAAKVAGLEELSQELQFARSDGSNETVLVIVEEMQRRLRLNDPELKAREAELNQGNPNPVSMMDILTNLERQAEAGLLKPVN